MSEEKKTGSFPMYDTAEEMQKVIDAYFEQCKGRVLTNDQEEIVRDKNGMPIFVDVRPPTITGLALALGFHSRQALLKYQAEDAFADTITRAKARVEQYAEERLYDKDRVNGAKFNLANNFEGWKEKKEIDADVKNAVTIYVELVDE